VAELFERLLPLRVAELFERLLPLRVAEPFERLLPLLVAELFERLLPLRVAELFEPRLERELTSLRESRESRPDEPTLPRVRASWPEREVREPSDARDRSEERPVFEVWEPREDTAPDVRSRERDVAFERESPRLEDRDERAEDELEREERLSTFWVRSVLPLLVLERWASAVIGDPKASIPASASIIPKRVAVRTRTGTGVADERS